MDARMPHLSIQVDSGKVVPLRPTPTLGFSCTSRMPQADEQIHTIALRCQIQIEVTHRRYAPEEQERLRDLFGHPSRWGITLRNLLWMNTSLIVPAFTTNRTTVDLQIPCTFDFNVAATKYFEGLTEGEIPLLMLFSGSVFYATSESNLRVAPISWELEARTRFTVQLWRELMEVYYPNSAWINLHKDVFDELHRFKIERGIPTWEQALEQLLAAESEAKS